MVRFLTGAAWSLAAATCLAALTCVGIEVAAPSSPGSPVDPEATSGGVVLVTVHSLVSAAFAVLGALVVSRRPRNAIGWLLVLIGISFAAIAVSNQVYLHVVLEQEPVPDVAVLVVWVGSWAFLPAFVSAIIFVPLLFPTGRPLSARWAALTWFVVVCGLLAFLGAALAPGALGGTPAVDNPIGVDSAVVGAAMVLGSAGLYVAAPAAIVSLVLRYRRSSGVERQQLRWLATAASLLPLGFASSLLVGDYAWPIMLVCLLVVAGAIAVAMLRYRLYDIDVVINRTLVYSALTATLAASYVGVVLLLQTVLRPLTAGSDIAVASSTLVVAALFRPARAFIQQVVDRRFYRRRYDAQLTVAEFADRLRQQVDLESLAADLSAVVTETVQPQHVSLWLRSTPSPAVTIPGRSLGRPEAEGRPPWPR